MPDTATPPFADTGIRPSARIPVRFSGDGAGTAELSWGQREIWRTMVRQRSWLPIGGWSRLAPGTTLADVAEELRWLMVRYQPLWPESVAEKKLSCAQQPGICVFRALWNVRGPSAQAAPPVCAPWGLRGGRRAGRPGGGVRPTRCASG